MPTCFLKKSRPAKSIAIGSLAAFGLMSAMLLSCQTGANAQDANNSNGADTSTQQNVSPVIIQSPDSTSNSTSSSTTSVGNTSYAETPPPDKKISYGIRVGAYMPTDSKAKNEFGNDWLSVGFFVTRLGADYDKGRLGADLRFISRSNNDNYIFMVPIGIEYRKSFNKDEYGEEHAIRPYVGATVDVIPVWMKDPYLGIDYGSSVTEGGSVFVGAKTGRIYIEARYQADGDVHSMPMSGTELTAGISF